MAADNFVGLFKVVIELRAASCSERVDELLEIFQTDDFPLVNFQNKFARKFRLINSDSGGSFVFIGGVHVNAVEPAINDFVDTGARQKFLNADVILGVEIAGRHV